MAKTGLPTPVDASVRIIWDYSHMGHTLKKCDAIFVLGSSDTRVAERAATLFLDGYGDYLIMSGGFGRLTSGTFARPEAEIFASIAIKMGVPKEKIIIENKSANTGENILFTHALLTQRKLRPKSLILVQKPYMERRTYATFKKQWPERNTEILVTSPQLSFDEYCNQTFPKDKVINTMVGDLQRIKEYAALGFQIPQEIPLKVRAAYQQLVDSGYTAQLIKK